MQYKIKELTKFSDTALLVLWEDGHESIYLYEDLRDLCPCAGCGKKGRSEKAGGIPGPLKKRDQNAVKKAREIKPLKIENVGHYAVRFYWSDGHSTGIYTFAFLRSNCSCDGCKTQE